MMAELVVIDASVAVAWLLRQSMPTWAEQLRGALEFERGPIDVRVPTFFWLEVGSNLVRQRHMNHEQMLEGITRLDAMGFADVELDRPARLRTIELAFRHELTTYDAIYLAVAVDLQAELATLDERLGLAAASYGLQYGTKRSTGVREITVPYGDAGPPDPISVAAIGAYIARFRTTGPPVGDASGR
jgi:predicted nucleic acid-binding protein